MASKGTLTGNETMTAADKLNFINAEYQKQLRKINQLTLTGWMTLAKELDVAMNDREHAAKKLAIRTLQAQGHLA